MGLIDYRTLLIECDEVLVDRDAGVWAALQPLLGDGDGKGDGAGAHHKDVALAAYKEAVRSLHPRFDELGFSGLQCFALLQAAERLGVKASWDDGMTFARSVPNWALFEDVPGAMLYLQKFYQLLVLVDRDVEDRGMLSERLGLAPERLLSLAGHSLQRTQWLTALDIDPADTLLLSRPPAQPLASGGLCLMRRAPSEHRQPCGAHFCISSMADLARQHQLSLRR